MFPLNNLAHKGLRWISEGHPISQKLSGSNIVSIYELSQVETISIDQFASAASLNDIKWIG